MNLTAATKNLKRKFSAHGVSIQQFKHESSSMHSIIRREIATPRITPILAIVLFAGYCGGALALWAPPTYRQSWCYIDPSPLSSSVLLGFIRYYCVVIGCLAGWWQAHRVHTSLTDTTAQVPPRIEALLRQVKSGVFGYVLLAGVPILIFASVCVIPGVIAAPVSLGMTKPLFCECLIGLMVMFATICAYLGRGRWFGIRSMPMLAVGVVVYMESLFPPPTVAYLSLFFPIEFLAVVLAFWSWYIAHSQQSKHRFPILLRLALAILLTFGVFMGRPQRLFAPFVDLICPITYNEPPAICISKNGDVCANSGTQELHPLNRKSSHTVLKMNDVLEPFISGSDGLSVEVADDLSFFVIRQFYGSTIWYLTRSGCLRGFDRKTRACIGEIQPPPDTRGIIRPFLMNLSELNVGNGPVLYMATASSLYQINLETRTLKPVFECSPDDAIIAYTSWQRDENRLTPDATRWETLLRTRQRLVLLLEPSSERVELPVKVSIDDFPYCSLFSLPKGGCVLRHSQPHGDMRYWDQCFIWVAADGHLLESILVPRPQDIVKNKIYYAASAVVTPPIMMVPGGPMKLFNHSEDAELLFLQLKASCFSALGFAVLAWFLTAWTRLSVVGRVSWSLWILVTGYPGALACVLYVLFLRFLFRPGSLPQIDVAPSA